MSFLLASPELDVKLIVSDSHNTFEKARIIAEFLRGGRDDIPIGIGVKGAGEIGAPETWIKAYPGKVRRDGVQALIDTIMDSKNRSLCWRSDRCPIWSWPWSASRELSKKPD